MLLLRRRQLPRTLPIVANLLAVGPGLTALLAVLVIVALHSEARGGEPHLLGARLMHLLFVFSLMTAIFFSLSEKVPQAPNPSSVLGVFGLSIRTTERDLDEEFTRFGHVEKVTIVYDQRVSFTLCPVI
jgi:hypothetical protein